MANTIQKRIKFSKGQIVPELVERTDLDLYDSSAQKMQNVVTSVYGGVRSRRGTKKIDRLFTGMTEVVGTASTSMGGTASYIQDKTNRYVSGAVGSNRKIFEISYPDARTTGTLKVRGIKFDFEEPSVTGVVSSGRLTVGLKKYTYYYYSNTSIVSAGVGVTTSDKIYPNPKTGWTYPTSKIGATSTDTPTFSISVGSKGQVSSVTITNAGKRTEGVPKSNLIFERKSAERIYKASAYYSPDGSNWTKIGTKTLTESPQDFDFVINGSFQYVKLQLDTTSDNIKTTLSMQYATLLDGLFVKGRTKLVDYLYNNQDKYVLVLSDEKIAVYKDGELQVNVTAGGLYANNFDDLKWTYKDDTIVFTHPDMPPKILKHLTDGTWTWGDLALTNIPYAAFSGETQTTKSVGITPSAEEGAIKITADSSVFTSSWVGNYIDGNGGRFKITEYVSGTVVNGYTTIPFYTKDKINSWTYISGYEKVWSVSRGYPRTCLFAQQRLWFGGSKSKPSTIWASRLGDYFNFKNSGSYDNDSIDVDLLTNDVIANLVDNRGIHILTTGQELTSAEGTYTPDKIAFTANTQNGSLARVRPVVIGGVVCFIEKNGKSLLSYVYNYEQASYLTDNMSLFTNLVQQPVAMAAEINSAKDRGDFLYIVLEDGTMLVGCVLISQNIMSLSQFKTEGTILDVCSVGGDTYIVVDRGTYNYLEKIDDVLTDTTTSVAVYPTQTQLYGWENFFTPGDIVYTIAENPSVGDSTYDLFGEPTGDTISVASGMGITVNGSAYMRIDNTNDTMSQMYVSVLSDYNGRYVYLYNGTTIYQQSFVSDGKIILEKPINATCNVGLGYSYAIQGNPIAINHKTNSIKKRITTADITCKDTPVLNFCGQTKRGEDNYKFYSCTKYDNDVRYNIDGEFYPIQILSLQLNINYEG